MRGRRLTGTDDVTLPEITTHDLAPLRQAPELCDLGDLDPDLALWPRTEVPRWPWTGPPTTGIWPLGWIGTDNQATVWVCTAGGQPGTWGPLTPGVVLPPSNGTDDTAMIQGAINTISATLAGTNAIGIIQGDPNTIYQLPNLFANTLTIAGLGGSPGYAALVLPSNVMLQGCNFNCPNPNFADNRYRGAVGISDGTVFCGVDHCSFEGHAVGPQTSEVPHEAILAGAATDVWITNNVCQHFYQSFLLALGTSGLAGPPPLIYPARWFVSQNDVRYVQGGAVKFDGGAHDIQILNNILGTNLSFPTYGAETILFNDTILNNVNVLIQGNQLFDCGPIDVVSVRNGLITGNRITWSAGASFNMAIGFFNAVNLMVLNNFIDWTAATATCGIAIGAINTNAGAIASSNVRVIGNTVLMAPAVGSQGLIYIQDSASLSKDLLIAQNYVSGGNAGFGIIVQQWSGVTVSDNKVSNPTSNASFGIYVNSLDAGIVDGNLLQNAGMFIGTPGNVDAEPYVVSGNKIYASNATNVAPLRAQARCTVIGNSFFVPTGSTASGALWIATNFGSFVSGNELHGAAVPAINDSTTGITPPHQIFGNYLRRDTGTPVINLAAGNNTIIRSNLGYNPVGLLTVAVPASGTAVPAANVDRTFYITASTSTVACAVTNAAGVSQTIATIPANGFEGLLVPAGSTFTPTYTAAPTWTVQGN